MNKGEQQFNQWFDEYANGIKVFEEADMKQAYLQGRVELEKENAELKHTAATLRQEKDNSNAHVKAMEIVAKTRTDQLTKAKDHIKKLLDCLKQDTNDPQTNYYVCQYMDKAEQFLSEVEK